MKEKEQRELREKAARNSRNTEMRAMLDQQVMLKAAVERDEEDTIASERAAMKVRWAEEEAAARAAEAQRRR